MNKQVKGNDTAMNSEGSRQSIVQAGVTKAHGKLIEQLYTNMDRGNVSKRGLMDMVGDSATMSSRTFSPQTNITLRTIVKNAEALGCDVEIRLVPRD